MVNHDLLLLKYLRNNARSSLAKLARKEDIPISTLFTKVNKLESNTIQRSTSLIDFSKLGFGLSVYMLIKLKENSKKEFITFLKNHPNTNNLSRINNGYDFFLEAIFNNMKSYTQFCEELKSLNIKTTKVFFAIEELKKEDFLTRDEHFKLFKE